MDSVVDHYPNVLEQMVSSAFFIFCLSVFSVCLSVFSVFLPVCLSFCRSFCLSVFLFVFLSVFLHVCLSVFLSVCPSPFCHCQFSPVRLFSFLSFRCCFSFLLLYCVACQTYAHRSARQNCTPPFRIFCESARSKSRPTHTRRCTHKCTATSRCANLVCPGLHHLTYSYSPNAFVFSSLFLPSLDSPLLSICLPFVCIPPPLS